MKATLLLISMFVLVFALPLSAVQNAPAPPTQSNEKTFEGQLVKTDASVKTITVKATAPDREVVFYYDDQTQVIGTTDGVQGLAGKDGTMLKVTYRESKGTNLATRIEIQPTRI